jgi:hypothetical protein
MITLQELYAAHTGKISDKWSLYLSEYERLFAAYRQRPIRLLEIGIQNGGSLELWAKYFEAAEAIVGCDIDPRCADLRFGDPRISVLVADANSTLGYKGILERSDRFDVIIDDGSHRSSDIVRSFASYFPHLEPGGLYIVEDLHCSYWQEYEGGLVDPDSSVAFFKLLVDVVNHEHWGVDKGRADLLVDFAQRLDANPLDATLAEIHAVEFVNSICVVRKAKALDNLLGPRVVAGVHAFETQARMLHGTESRGPRQESNFWTVAAVPTRAAVQEAHTLHEKLIVERRVAQRTVDDLREQIQRIQRELERLGNVHAAAEARLRERSNELALLKTQARRTSADLMRLRSAEVAMRKTLSWRIGAPVRYLERKRERRRSKRREKRIIEALAASGQFDAAYYTSSNPDVVQAAQDPLLHFVRYGAFEGRKPNPFFDPAFYLEIYPDVVAANVNPLLHYIQAGAAEGRQTSDSLLAATSSAASATEIVRYRVDRNAALSNDVLIYVAYCPGGRLSELQRRCIEGFAADGYEIVLVVNSGDFCHYVEPGSSPAVVQIVRENVGFDFGAWAHAVRLVGGLEAVRSVSFTNDSIIGPLGFDQAKSPRLSVDETPGDVVFMTECHEVRPHGQSYFFTLKQSALRLGALDVIAAAESFVDKHSLILAEEVTLASRMQELGAVIGYAFQCPQANLEIKNPTIHFWRELIDAGFPFVKVSLLADSLVAVDDSSLRRVLGHGFLHALERHLLIRRQGDLARAPDPNRSPRPALAGVTARFASNGALQAYNPNAAQTSALLVPLEGVAAPRTERGAIFVVVHCFYVDEAEIILGELAALRMPMRLLLTTDSEDKAAALQGLLSKTGLSGEVVVAPNRGRDVAPLLIEGGSRLGTEEYLLHLHTKKSPHNSAYAGWSRFLRRNLIGSPAIVESVLALMAKPDVGVIYSEHYGPVSGLRNWGHDFDHARKLLMRLGIELSSDEILDFPTSTMFWARVDALRPLFEAGLDYQDFEAEAGQVDGTLAHAIERCILYVAESAGFRHLKVISEDEPHDLPVISTSVEDIDYMLRMHSPRLLGSTAASSRFASRVSEVYAVDVAASKAVGQRLTVLIPTLKPAKVYGGVASALRAAKMLFDALGPGARLRLVVTSDDVDADSLQGACSRMQTMLVLTEPNDDAPGSTVVDLSSRRHLPLVLQRGDLLLATAWWTADLAFRLRNRQVELFGAAAPIVYLIQDYEPGFYPWSNRYAMALATYGRADDTIAVINCEELANFVSTRHKFRRAFHLPYQIEPRLATLLVPTVKRRQIVAYGRPGVARNLFEILVEGLRLWQGRQPRRNCEYRIVFAGESFDERHLSELENASCAGKLPLDAYAEVLNESAIGVSLMMSPHPSYPPLEMSSAGCVTITNGYDAKDLALRAPNILSLDVVTPGALADALDEAISRVRLDTATPLQAVAPVSTDIEPFDVRALVESLEGEHRP